MHISSDFLGVTFDFFLFGLLTYKLWGMITTHAIPLLHKMMRSIKKEQTELLDKEKLVTSTLSKIDNQRKQQQKMFALLEKKVQAWHKEASHRVSCAEEENVLRAQAIREKHEHQGKKIASVKVVQEALPVILQKAKENFIKHAAAEKGAMESYISLLKEQVEKSHG